MADVKAMSSAKRIVTIFESNEALSKPAEEVSLDEATHVAKLLKESLAPLMPAAGLAAPQIGISKRIFIFSWDRSIENQEVVINPKILFESSERVVSWEACFSTMREGEILAAKVDRPLSIDVEYLTLTGEVARKRLKGFAAKVFMHEYDHLGGIENVKKAGAETKSFSDKTSFIEFIGKAKAQDAVSYEPPIDL